MKTTLPTGRAYKHTAVQMLNGIRNLPMLTTAQAKAAEAAIADQHDPKRWRDPWKVVRDGLPAGSRLSDRNSKS